MPCCLCGDPLTIPNDEDEGPAEFPDDVELRCSHHYHWQCIIDHRSSVCPVCDTDTRDLQGKLFAIVRNEGGVTEDFDLGAEFEHEAFLAANPHIQRTEAFLALVDQGDIDAAEDLLDGNEPVDPNATRLDSKQTALHLAAYNNDVEAIQMLLRRGARLDVLDDSGQTPLECAIEVKAGAAQAALSQINT